MRFPSEMMPALYDQVTLQRGLEEFCQQIDGLESSVDGKLTSLNKRLLEVAEEAGDATKYINEQNNGLEAIMPTPTGVVTYKIVNIPFVWAFCKAVEIMKYPYVGGYQFFMSPEPNFTPMVESGYCDISGCAAATHLTVLTISATTNTLDLFATGYTDLRFWSDMSLVGKGIVNTTTGATGSISAWSAAVPLNCTTNIAWTIGDGYKILGVARPKNLVGQGPFPIAFKLISPSFSLANPLWDNKSYYCSVRYYSMGFPRNRKYGPVTTAVSTTNQDSDLSAPTVEANPFYYLNYVLVKWTRGDGAIYHWSNFSHWKVYRTTAAGTALCDDDTYMVADNVKINFFYDWGYDSVKHPNGPEPDKTYYYWVRAYDRDGNGGDLGGPDTALLGKAADPIIDGVTEEATNGFGFTKNYTMKWKVVGGAEQFWVKHRLKLNGTYGSYSLPVLVPYTTALGDDGAGNYWQYHTFQNLLVTKTYTFAVQAINHAMIAGLNSNWVTTDVAVGDSLSPDAPT
jgi:hypothetical protein